MARKLGDVAISLTILVFVIAGFSAFILKADSVTHTDSGIVGDNLKNLSTTLQTDTWELEEGLTTKTDETGTFNVENEAQQIEDRGSDSAGWLNIISKNVLTRFLNQAALYIPGFSWIKWLLMSLIAITISILLLRFFWGETKI